MFGGAFWTYLQSDFDCQKAIYNDVNPFMANLFMCCLDKKFSKRLEQETPQLVETFDRYKGDILNVYDDTTLLKMPDFEIGVKYAYIVTQIFSGIMGKKSKMIDLKGKYKSKFDSFRDRLKKPKIIEKLQKITVHNKSYEYIIEQYGNDTKNLIYLDPPYYGTENLYGFHDFNITHHEHVAQLLKKCKARWILSYYDFPLLSQWFPEDKYHWERKSFKKASAAQKGKEQSDGIEILIMNF